MTWTLHLLDDDGTEIGWVTGDPYEWSIDDSLPDADRLKKYLDHRDRFEHGGGDFFTSEDGVVYPATSDGATPITDFETELDELGATLVYTYSPADYYLADE